MTITKNKLIASVCIKTELLKKLCDIIIRIGDCGLRESWFSGFSGWTETCEYFWYIRWGMVDIRAFYCHANPLDYHTKHTL